MTTQCDFKHDLAESHVATQRVWSDVHQAWSATCEQFLADYREAFPSTPLTVEPLCAHADCPLPGIYEFGDTPDHRYPEAGPTTLYCGNHTP